MAPATDGQTDDHGGSNALGVILHPGRSGAEELLAGFAQELRAAGVRIGGLVQHSRRDGPGHARMELEDVATGRRYPISQALGAGSASCCVDPGGVADASAVLRRDLESGVDLLIVNKFSGMEAEGRGLAPELFEAVSRGVPVLTCLAERYRPQWESLTGNAGTFLTPDRPALERWWRGVSGAKPAFNSLLRNPSDP